VGKSRVWLLIAACVLIGLVAGTGLGRNVLNVPNTLVGSTSPAVHDKASNNISCFDTSPHKTILVTVAPDVQLEVLDWGGAGDTMVLLTGLGDNAHVTISSHTSSPTGFTSSASRAGATGARASPRKGMISTQERATTSRSSTV
jgi:hypothetical protein